MLDKLVNHLADLGIGALAPFVGAVLVFVIGFLLVKGLAKLLTKAFKKDNHLDPSVEKLIVTVVKVAGTFIILLVCAEMLSIPTSSLVTLLGTFGLAVSLSVQSVVANIASGIFIMVSKPFLTGHWIAAPSGEGEVVQIGLTHTTLKTGTNQLICIPNGNLAGEAVTNYSTEPTRRLDLTIPVSYDTDTVQAKKAIYNAILDDERILKDPAPFVRVWNLNSSSVDIMVRVWTKPSDYWEIRSALIENIKNTLVKENITIPFNPITVVNKSISEDK